MGRVVIYTALDGFFPEELAPETAVPPLEEDVDAEQVSECLRVGLSACPVHKLFSVVNTLMPQLHFARLKPLFEHLQRTGNRVFTAA
ncbi:hypothetical protein [Paenibacillus xylanexedens]|uniref:hypothetical protein n=1 Tax=Paenibacillus xylanexedens TaxID=528191 RepID=UPI001643E7AB|nr:hypothetical protein [Paenibacillus xylanexedens]